MCNLTLKQNFFLSEGVKSQLREQGGNPKKLEPFFVLNKL